MTRRLLFTLTLAATALVPVAAADAAKPAPYPTVSKVEPLNLGIGDTLKITGKNFAAGKNRNTVVFKRDGKKAIFVKAANATKTTLSVVVPEKLRTSLGTKNGTVVPTRFRLRILSKRFAKGYTALKSSPTIAPQTKREIAEEVKKAADALKLAAAAATASTATAAAAPPPPPDCDADGTPDASDPNDDADGLDDALEAAIKTDRCNVDTDSDGMEDGWEYKSAFDLNRESCDNTPDPFPSPCQAIAPAKYPTKKPYPNPLDGGDRNTDFDGDWLSQIHEHEAWKKQAGATRDFTTPLWYSGGLRASIHDGHTSSCRGMRVPAPFNDAALYSGPAYRAYSLDQTGWRFAKDGCLDDAERDEDNDFLGNAVELSEAMSGGTWWEGVMEEPAFRLAYEGTDWLDQDTDGDGVVDGKDDQDHDDFWNIEEIERFGASANQPSYGLWVNPFNPCLPSVASRTCPGGVNVGTEPWRPFYEDTKPTIRWPLYDPTPSASPSRMYVNEVWQGVPVAQQTMPPVHPLPRCWGGTNPGEC